MPNYDYLCLECNHAFERFQSMSAPRLKTCPKCKGKVKRLIGAGGGIIFKGKGFYQTDYRSSSYQKKAEADKPGTKPEKKGDGKGEKTKSPEVKPAPSKPSTQANGGPSKSK